MGHLHLAEQEQDRLFRHNSHRPPHTHNSHADRQTDRQTALLATPSRTDTTAPPHRSPSHAHMTPLLPVLAAIVVVAAVLLRRTMSTASLSHYSPPPGPSRGSPSYSPPSPGPTTPAPTIAAATTRPTPLPPPAHRAQQVRPPSDSVHWVQAACRSGCGVRSACLRRSERAMRSVGVGSSTVAGMVRHKRDVRAAAAEARQRSTRDMGAVRSGWVDSVQRVAVVRVAVAVAVAAARPVGHRVLPSHRPLAASSALSPCQSSSCTCDMDDTASECTPSEVR